MNKTITLSHSSAKISAHKVRHFFFSFLLVGILLCSNAWNIYSFFGQKGWVKPQNPIDFHQTMGHARAWYESPLGGNFLSGFFQKSLDEAAADHFPLDLLLSYIKAERWLYGHLVGLLPVHWSPVLPAGGPILSLRSENRLVNSPQVYLSKEDELLKKRADYYNSLIKKHPHIKLLIFPVLPAEDWLAASPGFWNKSGGVLAGKQWLERFRELLDPKVMYTWGGEGLPPDEAVQLYYLTDHHFTMTGGYMIYRQIINEFQKQSPIGYTPRTAQNWYTVPNVQFRGGHARLAGKFNHFYDSLKDADFGLPELSMSINKADGKQKAPMKEAYLQGAFPPQEFAAHYGNYYGGDYGMISYACDKAPDRNLLVLSDSFDNTFTPLLSSHYQYSFFVDLRHYKNRMGKEFVLSDFIKNNEIDDIIFFGRHKRVLGFRGMNR